MPWRRRRRRESLNSEKRVIRSCPTWFVCRDVSFSSKDAISMRLALRNLCIKIHGMLGSLSITNSLACELSASGGASPHSLSFTLGYPRGHEVSTIPLCGTIDRIGDQYSSIGPIRRLVLLYTILAASRKSLCAHSTVIYRSEITLYSLEYLEYLDKYRGSRGEDGRLG